VLNAILQSLMKDRKLGQAACRNQICKAVSLLASYSVFERLLDSKMTSR